MFAFPVESRVLFSPPSYHLHAEQLIPVPARTEPCVDVHSYSGEDCPSFVHETSRRLSSAKPKLHPP